MYDQIRGDTLFIILYSMVTAIALMSSCYMLFRRGNAFAPDITPPVRLRRWTAAFFAAAALSHLWYMPIFFLTSSEDIMMTDLVGGLVDSVTIFPLVIIVMLNMLQDRRRPLWPIALMTVPFVVGGAYSVATLSYALIPMLYVSLLIVSVCIVIYMVHATRQYGRWLRDNYADLEHKEVWQSFVILAFILLLFVFYAFISQGPLSQYPMQVFDIILIGYFLWRVETLSDLSTPVNDTAEEMLTAENVEDNDLSLSIRNRLALPPDMSKNIGLMLQKRCIDTQLYLQHGLTLQQLSLAIGTNRFYLSQYFSSQDMNYNAYINDLRINHFVGLYREALDTQRSFTVKQLAMESGFRSYNTFSDAFKRKMGLPVSSWIKAVCPEGKAGHEELGEP